MKKLMTDAQPQLSGHEFEFEFVQNLQIDACQFKV
jgi:hypothetical protein